jgi:two-component system, LytTR family, sensor histidine kinase AgrC
MNTFYTILFESIPEAWITLFFACCLLKPSLTKDKGRVFIYVVLIAVSSDILRLLQPEMELSTLIVFGLSLPLIRYILKVNWTLTIALKIVSFLVELIGEMLILYVVINWFSITPEHIMSNLWLKLGLPWFYLIPVLIISFYMKKKGIRYSISDWKKRKNKWLLPLVLLQLLFGLMFHLLFFLQEQGYAPAISSFLIHFPIVTFLMLGITFVILIYLRRTHRELIQESITATELSLVEQMEKMIFQWRSYNHDFHHHIEVLQTLLQEGNITEAQSYMASIHCEVTSNQQSFSFKQPVINALFRSKALRAEQQGIELSVESQDSILFPQLKSYDLVRILGNLLDNAMEALAISEQKEKLVSVRYQKLLGINILNVANNGPTLNKEDQQKVLLPGYSTKSESHHEGSGLAIIYDLVHQCGGEISITSNDQQTTFQIAIPEK